MNFKEECEKLKIDPEQHYRCSACEQIIFNTDMNWAYYEKEDPEDEGIMDQSAICSECKDKMDVNNLEFINELEFISNIED